ncbi:cold-shock protein [Williamsia phyllosphaerae]|uniref:DNA-binding protein n=1 Tax=Williamsia phyllosphaerae TaxID=885042 RepID=A0ABQ1UYQ9_9NOCA|nr:cold shock domain-containing protein [Williamsia phyllosphaerae]GGF28529.1 DNA-binding protein [Williamsia phyllosphaerae]
MAQAVTGKVVHYDANRGFGFLAPESGGADVFLHINDIDIDESELKPGAQVEFEVEETERGSKATNVSVIGSAPAAPPRGGRRDDSDHGARSDHGSRDHGSRDQGRDRAAAPRRTSRGSDSAVLDSAVFTEELTELLLDSSGSLTAEQIIAIRSRITDFAIARGWVVD